MFRIVCRPRLSTCRPQMLCTLNVPVCRKGYVISQNGFHISNQRKKVNYSSQILRRGKFYCSRVNYLFSILLSKKNIKIKIYSTIILPVILNGCETWSLTLREERRLKVFENRVWRKIFGPKKDKVTGVEKTTY